jgi:multiple sugar transport system substrate-binding protein
MKRSLKLVSVLAIVIMLSVIVLSACSKSNTNEKAETNTNTNTIAPESSAVVQDKKETGPVTLRLTIWGSPSEIESYKKSISLFEQKQDGRVKVQLEAIPTDYDTKLTTMVAGNQEPDVAMMESASLAFPLAEQGKWLNLEDYITKDSEISLDKLIPGVTYYSEPGNLIGIAPGPETFSLYYNADMFKAAGLTPPPDKSANAWTWDQFVDIAKKLTIDENGKNASEAGFDAKKIKQYGINIGLWWGAWSNFVYSNGGDFVSADGKTFGLNQPEAVDALQKLADLINKYHVAPSPVQQKNVPATNIALQTKKIAMAIDGQWANFDLGKSGFNYNIGVLPVLKTPVTTVVDGMFSVFKSTKHPQESWELLKALLNPEGTIDLNKGGLWMPALKEWYTNPDLIAKWTEGTPGRPSSYKNAVIDTLLASSHSSPTAYVKNFNKIMDIVNPALDKVWLGQQSAQEAMDGIAKKAQEQVQGRRDVK